MIVRSARRSDARGAGTASRIAGAPAPVGSPRPPSGGPRGRARRGDARRVCSGAARAGAAVCLVLAGAGTAWAGEVFSLERARALALSERPELVAGRARVRSAQARAEGAGAALSPRFGGRVEVGAAPGGQLVQIPGSDVLVSGSPPLEAGGSAFEPVLRTGATLGLDWTVLDFGRTAAARRAAEAAAQARAAELAQTRAELVAAVDGAYLAWVAADAQGELAEGAVSGAEARLAEAAARAEEGLLPPASALSAEYAAVAARLRAENAAHARARARLGLARALGRPLPEGARPDRGLLERGAERGEDAAEVAVSEARARAARARVEAAARADRPQLSVSAQAGLRGQEDRFFPVYAGGLLLTVPFFDGGATDAESAAAEGELRALEAQAEARRRARAAASAQVELDRAAARRQVSLAARLVEVAERSVDELTGRLEEAATTPDALAAADDRLDQARSLLIEAQLARARAALRR